MCMQVPHVNVVSSLRWCVCVLSSWTFVSLCVTVISSDTPVLIVWSIFSPCMYVFLCGWVCMCICVCEVCVVICLQLKIILFDCLPDFCFVVSLNQPICICVECPILKPVRLRHLYLLMTLLCSSASALPSILFCVWLSFFFCFLLHSSPLQILYVHIFTFTIKSSPYPLPMYIFVSLLIFLLNLQLCSLYTSFTCYILTLLALSPSFHLFVSPSSPFCLLSEGTARAPAGHLAVVKAAQTVTWSAWSHGPGAAPTQTAPTAPSGRPSLRLAASLASLFLPEGIALAAAKAHREAAKVLALVRTMEENRVKRRFI